MIDSAPGVVQTAPMSIPVARLNHAVLFVRDASVSADAALAFFVLLVTQSASKVSTSFFTILAS